MDPNRLNQAPVIYQSVHRSRIKRPADSIKDLLNLRRKRADASLNLFSDLCNRIGRAVFQFIEDFVSLFLQLPQTNITNR